jgi:hypothetical protein
LNVLLGTAVDKEFADVVVRVVEERDYSIHAAMECLCDEELLLTAAACTTEIISEELRALDISISVAEEYIVSMESDAVVQEEVLETVQVSLHARALRIESASHDISADLVVEATKTIVEEIVAHEVLWDCGYRSVCEDLMRSIEREESADVAQASLSVWEERTGLITEEVFSALLLDCIRDDCVIDVFFFELLLQESAEALTTTLLEEVLDHMTEEQQQEELLSEGMVRECGVGMIWSVVEEVVGGFFKELFSAARDDDVSVETTSYSSKDDGAESRIDSIQFHTPQLHSMDFMEGEYSVGASEVEFGSCFEGIAWSYAGTGISKPMNISALGSSESSSVENYSADAERSFASAGEDECTLNSEAAEVMSFMKQSSDGTSEYSADGENSVHFAQRNGHGIEGCYPWNASENRSSEENLTDIPLQSSDHPETLCSDEATGICIRTSSSDDRAMENVSMDIIYQKESPHEKEWIVSPLADGVVMGGRSVGPPYGSRPTEWVQAHSAEDEERRRSNRYAVVYSVNGDVYEGAVSADGLFQGHGKLTFFNGDVYEGSFLNGYRSGMGRYLYINGDVYEGHFKNGCKDGNGVYRYQASGALYEGSYVNDKRHGHGTYIYPNGGKYIGEYINGKKTIGGMYLRRPLKS